MKALGSDIVEFFNSAWPTDWYVDDGELEVNEKYGISSTDANVKTEYPLDQKYDLEQFGYLCSFSVEKLPTLSNFFSKWKKSQTHVSFVVSVEIARESEIKELLIMAGVEVK